MNRAAIGNVTAVYGSPYKPYVYTAGQYSSSTTAYSDWWPEQRAESGRLWNYHEGSIRPQCRSVAYYCTNLLLPDAMHAVCTRTIRPSPARVLCWVRASFHTKSFSVTWYRKSARTERGSSNVINAINSRHSSVTVNLGPTDF